MGPVSSFLETHYKHFNARETLDAAKAYKQMVNNGGKMIVTLAGAMSTGELGKSLAEMIRQDKVHAISSTAANLEEDLFNLFSQDSYKQIPYYRDLTPTQEQELLDQGMNRVTDVCIPETVMREVEGILLEMWVTAEKNGTAKFPYEFMYELLDIPEISQYFKIPAKDSWVIAAKEKNLKIFTPGWEDSSLANMFTSWVMNGKLHGHTVIKTGTAQMENLANWYLEQCSHNTRVGFFQIGGGIAGDFPICVVPMLNQDLKKDIPYWAYFAQIGDSTTSYGSYSGAVPNEKITWGKLNVDTPKFMINSDASIVAPLVFAYVLDW